MKLVKKYLNPNTGSDKLDINGSSNPYADFATKWQQATDRGETSDPMEETRQRILDRLNNNTYYWIDTDGSIKQDYLTDDAAVKDYRRKSGTATPLNWEFNLIAPAKFGLGAIGSGIRTGLQAMNTAFTPSTWLNPVTGAKLLSPTVGTIADAGIQGAFAYKGLNGLWNQGSQGTLLNNPASTFMHGLEVLPLAGLGSKAVGMGVDAWNKSGMKALWDISRNNAPVNIESSLAPKTIEYVKREPTARLDFLERNPSRISDAERAGIPKGDRNSKTIDRPNRWFPEITESNVHRISDAQWDAAYNKAIADNNTAEVQRLRALHFYAKTGETPMIQYRGSSNTTLRNTYYRNDGSAVWFTPDEDAASFYTPPGTNRPPRAHYIKTKDGKILHVDGATKNFDGSTIPSNWASIPVENIPENVSKHFPEEELSIGNKIRFKSKPSYVNTGDVVHAAKLEGYNQVDFQNIVDAKASSVGVYPQFTTRYYNNIKLADPITYDNAGNIIPLSKRDNFNSSDLRYSWLPWIFGGGTAGYNYLNQDNTSSEYANGGKLIRRKL